MADPSQLQALAGHTPLLMHGMSFIDISSSFHHLNQIQAATFHDVSNRFERSIECSKVNTTKLMQTPPTLYHNTKVKSKFQTFSR